MHGGWGLRHRKDQITGAKLHMLYSPRKFTALGPCLTHSEGKHTHKVVKSVVKSGLLRKPPIYRSSGGGAVYTGIYWYILIPVYTVPIYLPTLAPAQ